MRKVSWVLMAGLILGCTRGKVEEGKTEATKAVPVEVAEVFRGDIRSVLSFTGDIKPWRQVNVVPDVPGKVARIYVEEGDRVRKGQVLAELDTRMAKLQLEQAEAGLAVAEANFESASKDWERMQELHEKGTVSPQQYEKAQMAYEMAKAQLQQAKAALDMAKHQLEVSTMRAPFDGVITGRNINEGEYINPAMSGMGPRGPSVVTLMDISKVKVEVEVPERDIAKVEVGQEAEVKVDPYPGRVFRGKVHRISPAADPMARTFEVEVEVPNRDMDLRPGMFARVRITTQERKGVLLVPLESIVEEGGSSYVFVVRGNRVSKRPIKLGLTDGRHAEVLEGVSEGEKVVTTGKEMLEDGSEVAIK